MAENKDSYRNVVKATSLFGGVQVLNILISIVRSKVIALLIGPTGMGIAGLLSSTMSLVNGLTNFGLENSAVKDISFANNNEDQKKVFRTINILRRLVWYTVTLGVLIMIIAAPLLSEYAFGNKEYTNSFRWISLSLLFTQLSSSQLAVLQGLRRLKSLAKANLFGNLLGLIITLPLYYFFRIDAIVPAIIIAAFMSFIFTFYFIKKESIQEVSLTNKQVFVEGKAMITLGLMLSFSSMITLLVAYVIRIYISKVGGVNEVGLYTAGFLILNSYVGIVFNAMGTDYFPRLAAISEEIIKIRKAVFEQALIAVLLITPIIVIFLTFSPLIITILYSEEFLPIVGLVSWGILGMLFKAVSWSMGYVIIAKGDSKVFIKTAIVFNSLLLLLNIFGYYYGGLEGLGISFLIYYIIHYFSIRIITYYRYNFYFEKGFYKIFIFTVIMCLAAFGFTFISEDITRYVLMSIMILLSVGYSYRQLDERIAIKDFISSVFKRKK